MSTISTNTGFSFLCNDDKSIVDCAIESGLFFPYSCRSGTCKVCICQLISGKTKILKEEIGLSEDEKKLGWILGCARTSVTDLIINAPKVSKHPLPEIRVLPCRISEIDFLSVNVIRVTLRLPPNSCFQYYPGQYIEIIRGDTRRSYSIANTSHPNGLIELHIKRFAGGVFSKYWFEQAKVNDLLRLNGPLGTFFLKAPRGKNLIFLATGTGIAPIKAILESLSQLQVDERPNSLKVYWGGRCDTDFYTEMPNIDFPYVFKRILSRSDDHKKLSYVQEACLADISDFTNTQVFACGANVMIEAARHLLVKSGLQESEFHSDAFVRSG